MKGEERLGKNDIRMKRWLSDKRRFSSLVNGALFGHQTVFSAETLHREEYKMLQKYIPNYSINIINPSKIEDLSCFEQDLQMVFGMLKYRKDKNLLKTYINENKEYFEHVDEETYDAAVAMLGAEKLMKQIKNKESEERNMCKAIDDIYNDGISLGKAEGKAEAILELLEMMGNVSEKVRDIISSQTDLRILSCWLRTAVRVNSISEFEAVLAEGFVKE